MTELVAAPTGVFPPWTCPFCPLACDHLGVEVGASAAALSLKGGACARAQRGLAQGGRTSTVAAPQVNGQSTDLASAVKAAAALLGGAQQPLFGGLGTDVAGARALYALACATGAISDAGAGAALMHGLRALQDRGQFTTTLSEVRTRADLLVFVGGLPTEVAPLIDVRCGIGDVQVVRRHVVVVAPSATDHLTLASWCTRPGVTGSCVTLQGDLFDTLGELTFQVSRAGRGLAPPVYAGPRFGEETSEASNAVAAALSPATELTLAELADLLHAARYAVLVGAPARLPAQGALLVEAVHRIVESLNKRTRAAALWVGGGNGAATVNQVFAWLSGLPLRSRAGVQGLEHEPWLFDAGTLLSEGAVDALLWVSSFDAEAVPPTNPLPMVVLGHPGLDLGARAGQPTVFIPVSTPGLGSAGHVFRTDGTVLMPLPAVYADTLPTLDRVVKDIAVALAREGQS